MAGRELGQAHLSGLLLQRRELLDRTLNIRLECVSVAFDKYNRSGIPVLAVQLQESVCQPPWRSPCQVSTLGRRTL
jgi:hypothetical protein